MGKHHDHWNALCEQVEADDGLPAREVGAWTRRKLYFWMRYVDITTNAMYASRYFPGGLAYVDLFAGSGVCTLKKSRQRIPGSVLIAASTSKPFTRLIACEKDPTLARACRTRLLSSTVADRCTVIEGDCNQLIDEIINAIPSRSLTLAFIDPAGLDIEFETVRKLSTVRADLAVLFADAYDINRNHEAYYRKNENSKLDKVLGPDSGWRGKLDASEPRGATNDMNLFARIYKEQLRIHLGYSHFDDEIMKFSRTSLSRPTPLYRIIYASKHSLGLKFWREAKKKEAGGQGEFKFPE